MYPLPFAYLRLASSPAHSEGPDAAVGKTFRIFEHNTRPRMVETAVVGATADRQSCVHNGVRNYMGKRKQSSHGGFAKGMPKN